MRYLDILFEFDLQKTIQNYSKRLLDRSKADHSAKNKSIEEIINLFVQSDPTSKKAYALWMINTYLSNGIRFLEDLGRTNEALISYIDLKFKNKLKPEHKDINKIKSLNELEGLIDEYKEKPIIPQSERQREKELEQEFYKNKEAILFYNDNEIKVVVPKTERASCFFGRNTKWCTAATNNNRFSIYNINGPLFIILIKKENKRFQFHFEMKQFMDEKDQPINWNEIEKYPQIKKIFSKIAEDKFIFPLMGKIDKKMLTDKSFFTYNLEYLPNDLTVDRLQIGPDLKELPKGLRVDRLFISNNRHIQHIPDDIHVGSLIIEQNTEIKILPDDLYIYEMCSLSKSSVEKLPSRMRVGTWMDLSNSKITEIPKDLDIGFNKSYGEAIIVKKDHYIKIDNTKINLNGLKTRNDRYGTWVIENPAEKFGFKKSKNFFSKLRNILR